MRRWKYVEASEIMERVDRQEFVARSDEILESVRKNNVGFVITDADDTGEYTLCPADWMGFHFDNDFGCIITSAIRYSINRNTYMPDIVVRFIRKYMNVLDTNTIKVALEDIEQELEWGTAADPAMWSKLKEELLSRQAYLLEAAAIQEAKLKHKDDRSGAECG